MKVGMWSAADVRGTAAAVAPWWTLLTKDVPADVGARLQPPPTEPTGLDELQTALSALSHAGRQLTALGYGMAPQSGSVAGLFAGDGGVPKHSVSTVRVEVGGIVGDRQKTRKHHGRVWQALCLWSAEVVTELAGEGHPVFPGACGENVLVSGIDWAAVRPGARIRLGGVLAEITLPTIPCKQIRPYFAGARICRVDHDRHPGFSRWYASVVAPGAIAVGDVVLVEPPA